MFEMMIYMAGVIVMAAAFAIRTPDQEARMVVLLSLFWPLSLLFVLFISALWAIKWDFDVAKSLVYVFTPREGEDVCTVEQARAILMGRVMNKARYPAQSTSPTSNLMEQFEAAACAEALDYLEYL